MVNTTCLDTYGNTVHWFTQWDVNQKLIVQTEINKIDTSNPIVVHFCNKNTEKAWKTTATIGRTGTENMWRITANIPNKFLEEATPILAYIYLSDYYNPNSKKTIIFIKIPVRKRPQPNDLPCSSDIEVIEINDKIEEIEKIIKEIEDLNLEGKILQLQFVLEKFRLLIATPEETKKYLKDISGVEIS